MADNALILRAERWNDIILLSATKSNIDGDQGDTWTPPIGVGDIAVMEIVADVINIATMVVNPELQGAVVKVVTAAQDVVVDFAGVARWSKTGAAILSLYVSPDPLVLIRSGEKLAITFPELDTNATAAGDLTLYVKAVRVQPQQAPAAPIQLVR